VTVQKKLFAAATAALVALGSANLARAADSELEFTVLRNGDPIGSHEIDVTERDGKTMVDIETEVAVKLAFVTLYNFDHEGHEVWQDGHLVSYRSKTDDDGTDKALNAKLDGDALAVEGSASRHRSVPTIIPASLWNPATVGQSKLLNTLDGSEMAVSVADKGMENVDVRGQQVPARHYVLTGELQRELWYDASGRLVKVRFAASDGSDIQYVLK
jgi:hypothetical protein